MPEQEVDKETEKLPTASIVLRYGEPTEIVRKSNGQFGKKQHKMIPTREVTRAMRKWLESTVEDGSTDGKLTKKQKTRMKALWDAMYKIATTEDSKAYIAAVQAFNALMSRAHGDIPKNEDEQEDLKQNAVRTVFVPIPVPALPSATGTERVKPELPSFAREVAELQPGNDEIPVAEVLEIRTEKRK